ncbi:MAG: hypothetical protein QOF46_1210, partial [Paraburkholderia sp.]|nr:hypothetical protein [Paraburkholderia sp.]
RTINSRQPHHIAHHAIFTLLAGTVQTMLGGDCAVMNYARAAAAALGLTLLLWVAFYLIMEKPLRGRCIA